MPDHSRGISERRDLVDDDTPARLVARGVVPGRAEHRVQRGRRAALDGQRELGDQLPFACLLRRHPLPRHHVVRGDRLEQRALEQLAARHREARRVPAEHGQAASERRLLGRLAEAADQLAGEVLGRGQRRGPAVEAEPPAGQLHELGEHRLEFRRRDVPRRRAVGGAGDA
jgi:hypothetical protein